ncbi:MAG TPA: ArsR family transcriptional regulator, partial [Gammaproteobacteria bacterium]|nr:ArsR family transcriptional regulator [Gammaproteobacteria bacterium]
MSDKTYNILFLCTGNSARSVMAEALMNRLSEGRFRAFSAGSHPAGVINPLTLELLKRQGFVTDALRSKNWDTFALPDAPAMDFVITVCDKAAGESCPVWPGQPMTAHWGVPDPVELQGDDAEKMMAFRQVFRELENRIKIFVSLPFDSLDSLKLQQALHDIGKTQVAQAESEPV